MTCVVELGGVEGGGIAVNVCDEVSVDVSSMYAGLSLSKETTFCFPDISKV